MNGNRNSGLMIKSKSNVIETVDNFNVNGRDAVVGLDHQQLNKQIFFDERDLSKQQMTQLNTEREKDNSNQYQFNQQ